MSRKAGVEVVSGGVPSGGTDEGGTMSSSTGTRDESDGKHGSRPNNKKGVVSLELVRARDPVSARRDTYRRGLTNGPEKRVRGTVGVPSADV